MIVCIRDICFMKKFQPNLSNLFVEHQQDVQTIEGKKGFIAKYMTWAKVASIFNQECPGWSHHCRLNPQDGHPLFDAPDNSCYFIFYFKDPDNNEYGDFIYPIMDSKKNSLSRDQICAREISDHNRRGFVAHCCHQFGLFHQLWSKEEIDDNKPKLKIAEDKVIKKTKYDSGELIEKIMNEMNHKMKDDEQRRLWVVSKANQYKLQGDGSKLKQMSVFQLRDCLKELENGRF